MGTGDHLGSALGGDAPNRPPNPPDTDPRDGPHEPPPLSHAQVADLELGAIAIGRRRIGQPSDIPPDSETPGSGIGRLHRARLMGLALSGGGIRSATFNLGVLQGLARLGLLKHFDYLSTVSGGGYIGSWLHAWVCRESRKGGDAGAMQPADDAPSAIERVEAMLGGGSGPIGAESPEVSWLRRYSNYLTPRASLLSGDTMAAFATWLRNVILNQSMLLLLALAAVVLPWLHAMALYDADRWMLAPVPGLMLGFGLVALGIGSWLAGRVTARAFTASSPGDGVNEGLAGRKPPAPDGPSGGGSGHGTRAGATWVWTWLLLGCLALAGAISVPRPDAWRWILDWLDRPLLVAIGVCGIPYALPWLIGSRRRLVSGRGRRRVFNLGIDLFAALAGGAVLGGLLVLLAARVNDRVACDDSALTYLLSATFVPPLVVAALFLAATLHIGLAGRVFPELLREWWSRVGGILVRAALLWTVFTGLGLFGAYAVIEAGAWAQLGGLVWLATTAGGVLAGHSAGTWGGTGLQPRELLVRVAPSVFLLGLLLLVSWTLYGAILWLGEKQTPPIASDPPVCSAGPMVGPATYQLKMSAGARAEGSLAPIDRSIRCDAHRYADSAARVLLADDLTWPPIPMSLSGQPWWLRILILSALAVVLALALGVRIDINVFALHMLYRNRLERCYLGASNSARERGVEPWTDLARDDSPRLDALKWQAAQPDPDRFMGQRPYPLINAALNLTQARNLAWQERKAASFVFTPDCCGYELPARGDGVVGGYRRTNRFLCGAGWLSLSQAMTISGAAASPNAGYHTNPAIAALMTIFNARLGWWMQNPARTERPGPLQALGDWIQRFLTAPTASECPTMSNWERTGPHQALHYLGKELFASASETDHFVYLSDGGHFENLGLYELVRRRCRFIVVCDAGCDPDYGFEDLGNAIRKCRSDLGIPIDIDTRAVPPGAQGSGAAHCTVGTIHYEKKDGTAVASPGYLVYLKASLTGDEPGDVRQYKASHPKFPHETTGDQWFTESQFESYRALGEHIVLQVFGDARADERRERERRGTRIGMDVDRMLHAACSGQREHVGGGLYGCGGRLRDTGCDRQVLFERLAARWYPPSRFAGKESAHKETIRDLLAQIRRDTALGFLDGQLYPEWDGMRRQVPREGGKHPDSPLPPNEDDLRAGFYFCGSLIHMMEAVYSDLHLEQEHQRPSNRGWMNLFRQCAGSGMFRVAWAMTAPICSARFQQFCHRHIGLDIGRVVLGAWTPVDRALAQARHEPTGFPNPIERHEIEALADADLGTPRSDLYLVPLRLRVEDPQTTPPTRVLYLDIGLALMGTGSGGRRDRPPRLIYFRIRDHLRRMGLGRRGLEAIWREDCRIRVDAIPELVSEILADTDRDGALRLWQSVLAAVPHREIQTAERLLRIHEALDRMASGCVGLVHHGEIVERLVALLPSARDGGGLTEADEKRLIDLEKPMSPWIESWDPDRLDVGSVAGQTEPGANALCGAVLREIKSIADEGRREPGATVETLRERSALLLRCAASQYRDALVQQPDNEEALRGIARVLERRARRAGQTGRHQEAKAWWADAIAILNKVIEANEYASLAYYNRACYRALSESTPSRKRLRRIRQDLEHALAIRPDFQSDIDRDPDLKVVRETPRHGL